MNSRDETIKAIRAALKSRSTTPWSVKGGTGTAYGWITIQSAPRVRRNGYMTASQRIELRRLLNLDGVVHIQGLEIPASHDYYNEYVARAEGRTPEKNGFPYWD